MRNRSCRWVVLIAALALVSVTGCATVNSTFVYKPSVPLAGGSKLPVKVAVVAFADGTEDFTRRGSILAPETLRYNLAKAGIGGQITALTPEVWGKAFADEIAASGSFQAARFVYSSSELVDEDYYIEGTVEKAYVSGAWDTPNEIALALRALRRTDNRLVWEKGATRAWTNQRTLYDGCGAGVQCMVDRGHAEMNRLMREMFAEAREDLVRTLAPLSGSRRGEDRPSSAASPAPRPPTESVDETIEGILKEKR